MQWNGGEGPKYFYAPRKAKAFPRQQSPDGRGVTLPGLGQSSTAAIVAGVIPLLSDFWRRDLRPALPLTLGNLVFHHTRGLRASNCTCVMHRQKTPTLVGIGGKASGRTAKSYLVRSPDLKRSFTLKHQKTRCGAKVKKSLPQTSKLWVGDTNVSQQTPPFVAGLRWFFGAAQGSPHSR